MLTILDAATQSACAAATTQQGWCEALVAAWSGGNVTARLFAPDSTTLRRTLTLGPFTVNSNTPRQVVCAAHLADTAVSTGAPGLWVFRAGSTDIFSIDAGTGSASVNHAGSIKTLCTPTIQGVTFTAPSGLPVSAWPAWRAAMTTSLEFRSLTPVSTLAAVDPKLDAALNANGAGNVPPWTGASYPQADLLNAWGAGAYSRTTKKLKVRAQGGHLGHQGNEGYDCDLSASAPAWVRVCPPSGSIPRPATFTGGQPVSGSTNEVCTDERPKAIHGYGGGVQDPTGRYFQMPGGAANDLVVGNVWTQRPYRFVGDDWDATGSAFSPGYSGPSTAVYDPDLGAIWCMWGTRTYRVDPETLAAVSTTATDGAPYYGTAAYANGYVMSYDGGYTGGLYLMVFATSAPGTFRYHRDGTGGTLATTGTPPPSPSNKYYSIAWDSIRGRLLVYNGGPRMFTLTPPGSGSWVTGTWTWGELTCSTASYTPPTDSGNGIFGRFFFDADYNCAVCQPSDVTAPLIVLPLEA